MTTLSTPVLIINAKNYLESSGERGIKLAKSAESVAKELGVNIIIAPPTPLIYTVVKAVDIPVYAEHVDISKVGSTTGFIVPELVKDMGAAGSIINHSEHQLPVNIVAQTVERLKQLGMGTVVCAVDHNKTKIFAEMNPDAVAVEPPELIGSGIAVSKARPEVITDSLKAVRAARSMSKLICGAGIVTGEDVKKALELGAEGVLVASGIVKAADPEAKILELAEQLRKVDK
ncbi:MAG: triose-phosphate isomerase [Nitrososphaeria archaeon]|jgi:triosephosphate isomerase